MRVNENAHRLRDLLFREWKLIVILGMSAVIRFRHLGSEIGGSYDFRQAQTAWGVRSLTRGSLNPLDAEVPVLGPPWKLPFEFPLYQWLAAIVGRVLALNELTAARLAAIGFFLLTLLLLHVLVRGILDSQHATLVTVTMSFGAFGLHYGSAILVDFSALAFSLAALIAAHRVLRQWSTLGLAIVAVLAALAHLFEDHHIGGVARFGSRGDDDAPTYRPTAKGAALSRGVGKRSSLRGLECVGRLREIEKSGECVPR